MAGERFHGNGVWSKAYLAVLIIWLPIAFSFLIAMAKQGVLLYSAKPRPPYIYVADFLLFYKLGKIAGSKQRFHIYDQSVQQEWNNRMISPLHTDKVLFAPYVPWLLPMLIPLGALPLKQSYLVWCLSTLGIGLSAFTLLIRTVHQFPKVGIALFLCGALASYPGWLTLAKGQSTWMILGLCSLFIWSYLKHRDLLAGIFLSLLSQKPQYAIFLAVAPLAQRRWLLLVSALTSEAVLLVMAGFCIGWHNIWNYPSLLLNPASIYHDRGVAPPGEMISLRAPLSVLLPQADCLKTSLLLMGAGCLAIFRLGFKGSDRSHIAWLTAFSLTASVLLSPHGYLYDCLLMAPVAVLAWNPYPGQCRTKSLIAFRTVMIVYPLLSWWLILSVSPTAAVPYLPFLVLNLTVLLLLWRLQPPSASLLSKRELEM